MKIISKLSLQTFITNSLQTFITVETIDEGYDFEDIFTEAKRK